MATAPAPRPGRHEIPLILDPLKAGEDGKTSAYVLIESLRKLRDREALHWKFQNLVTAVETLRVPEAIFRGLRWCEDDTDQKWWCFVARPRFLRRETGEPYPFPPNKVYVACMNASLELFEWRREDADVEDPSLPLDWRKRFGGMTWQRPKLKRC